MNYQWKIKGDLEFSNSVAGNTFPVPELPDKQRTMIIRAGEKVLAARARHPERHWLSTITR